jgi:hypothetical protein
MSDWLKLLDHPSIYVDLKTGRTVDFGEVHGKRAERIVLGQVSHEALAAIRLNMVKRRALPLDSLRYKERR